MSAFSENALTVLKSRYLRKNSNGEFLETPEELLRRVAREIGAAEMIYGKEKDVQLWQDRFYELMDKRYFLPNSPTLMNAGTQLNQLSACFVLPVEDNIKAIFDTLGHTALVQQSGGGTGFNFSKIRPKNDYISTTGGEASGPVSFMQIFNASTEHIKQGGKRRGANMGILNVDHPDIEDFIDVKLDPNTLNNFNISVAVSNFFMKAVENDADWSLLHPTTRKEMRIVKARYLWNKILSNAWKTGDPGLIFIDAINDQNPTPAIGKIECTNPCGEVPLLPYESCNLGSINLSRMLMHKKDKLEVDWDLLEEVVVLSTRFLDNVIDANSYILPQIQNMVKGNRKIGLGVMGWAEMLIQLEIPYASNEAIILGEKIMQFISEKSFKASADLAIERGSFPNWEKSIYYPNTPLRNATRTSVAPTGTISIIADTSPSIEPLFALAFRRENVLKGEVLSDYNKLFLDHLQKNGLNTQALLEQVRADGNAGHLALPENTRKLFSTSMEIDFRWHIRHQVAFQKHTDNAVSKTINLPHQASVMDIEEAYLFAWKQGAKGITVFRDGSKGLQVMNKGLSQNNNVQGCKVCVDN